MHLRLMDSVKNVNNFKHKYFGVLTKERATKKYVGRLWGLRKERLRELGEGGREIVGTEGGGKRD